MQEALPSTTSDISQHNLNELISSMTKSNRSYISWGADVFTKLNVPRSLSKFLAGLLVLLTLLSYFTKITGVEYGSNSTTLDSFFFDSECPFGANSHICLAYHAYENLGYGYNTLLNGFRGLFRGGQTSLFQAVSKYVSAEAKLYVVVLTQFYRFPALKLRDDSKLVGGEGQGELDRGLLEGCIKVWNKQYSFCHGAVLGVLFLFIAILGSFFPDFDIGLRANQIPSMLKIYLGDSMSKHVYDFLQSILWLPSLLYRFIRSYVIGDFTKNAATAGFATAASGGLLAPLFFGLFKDYVWMSWILMFMEGLVSVAGIFIVGRNATNFVCDLVEFVSTIPDSICGELVQQTQTAKGRISYITQVSKPTLPRRQKN